MKTENNTTLVIDFWSNKSVTKPDLIRIIVAGTKEIKGFVSSKHGFIPGDTPKDKLTEILENEEGLVHKGLITLSSFELKKLLETL